MATTRLLDRRFKARKSLTGLLPGPLTRADGSGISCKPVDISIDGIGILSEGLLKTDELLTMKLGDSRLIEFKVSWIKRDFGKRDLFRYGLQATDESFNLEAIFIENGCLK